MSQSSTYHLDVEEIVVETDDAFGVRVEDMVGLVWIPRSQIFNRSEINPEKGDTNLTFDIPEWLAKDKGFC